MYKYIYIYKQILHNETPKSINLLDNAPNQPSQFRTKNIVEMNN